MATMATSSVVFPYQLRAHETACYMIMQFWTLICRAGQFCLFQHRNMRFEAFLLKQKYYRGVTKAQKWACFIMLFGPSRPKMPKFNCYILWICLWV